VNRSFPLIVIGLGDFGEEIAERIARIIPRVRKIVRQEDDDIQELLHDRESLIVLASWRPAPVLSEFLDRRSYLTGIPFISLVLRDHDVLLGPVVVPGIACCWRCWSQYDLCIEPNIEVMRQRTEYYKKHRSEGPRGFLASMASFASIQLAKLLSDIDNLRDRAGTSMSVDIRKMSISFRQAIGQEHCGRCGQATTLESRSYESMKERIHAIGLIKTEVPKA
jgi:bacteriocin biosynthesis cyclodehydratase domain-containing protein